MEGQDVILGNESWFEESLSPSPDAVDELLKSLPEADVGEAQGQAEGQARAQIFFAKPRWSEIDKQQSGLLESGGDSRFVLVRLGYEFALTRQQRDEGARLTFAKCSAYLWPSRQDDPPPSVYEVIPKDLYDGEPRVVQVRLSPSIGVGPVNASLGELSTSITVGHVEPAVIGWTGEAGREPYWELRPQSRSLLGTRYLWMVVELPLGCAAADIAASASAEIETLRFARLAIGPKSRTWSDRPRETIGTLQG